jgi:hypothetical protein
MRTTSTFPGLTRRGHPGTLDAFIDQSGNGNSATQYQKGAVNLAITNQMGNGGMAVQKQGNSQYIDGNSYGGFAAIVQLASSNGSEAQQHQAGVFNVAGIIQGSDLSVAKQEQVSDKDGHPDDLLDLPNVAGIIQMEGVVFHRGNKAYQVQYYDGVSEYGNWAGALQVGGHNVSVQKQIGGNNLSGVDQHGLANEAYVSQTNGATPPAMGMSVPGPF